jgi:4-amino-4-deoxy-L-arabinose transferase-like glycosyltransferase
MYWRIALLICLGGGAIAYTAHARNDPSIILLTSHEGAQWLKVDEPLEPAARPLGMESVQFKTAIDVPADFRGAVLNVWALRACNAQIDEQPLTEHSPPPLSWKVPHLFDLPPLPSPGRHALRFTVTDADGPCLLCASCPALDLRSGRGWETSRDGGATWRAAAAASDPEIPPSFTAGFETNPPELLPAVLLLATIFVATFFIAYRAVYRSDTSSPRIASAARWGVLIAWFALAANNFFKVPYHVGFDVKDHLDYIAYIAREHRLPLPSEGWQFFQSPLFYLLSAPLFGVLLKRGSLEAAVTGVRIIPLLSGLLMTEACFRALRHVYPNRSDLQAMGTIFGGLLPMNLYMAQTVSNEPLAGLLSAMAIVLTLGQLAGVDAADPSDAPPRHPIVVAGPCGLVLGLALLTKVSAALLIPPIVIAWLFALSRRGLNVRKSMGCVSVLLLVAAIVCGWYYIRNWIEAGSPFVAGWDRRRMGWWQDPGFRVPEHFERFGYALTHPIYAGVRGVWDSLYSTLWADGFLSGIAEFPARPPWNYTLMHCGIWIALLPTAALAVGFVRAILPRRDYGLIDTQRRAVAFAAGCVGIFFAAVLYLYLKLPIYTTAKASYMLGVTPCFALLAASGVDQLPRRRWIRAAVMAVVLTWAVDAYLTYFVV